MQFHFQTRAPHGCWCDRRKWHQGRTPHCALGPVQVKQAAGGKGIGPSPSARGSSAETSSSRKRPKCLGRWQPPGQELLTGSKGREGEVQAGAYCPSTQQTGWPGRDLASDSEAVHTKPLPLQTLGSPGHKGP